MDLKERLEKILKEQYGIETASDLMQALDELPDLDFGIFVNPMEDVKSA